MKRTVFIICLFLAANLAYSQNVITIKKGETKTLSAFGGSGKVAKWYSGSCGGTLVGTGESIKVTPTQTTTYYGRWEDGKKFSDCETVTIIVEEEKPKDIPQEPSAPEEIKPINPPINISTSFSTIPGGQSTTLSYSGGSGKTFKWYSGSCGGTLVGEGNDLSVTPTETTTYYGRWENDDSVSDCQSITVEVKKETPTVNLNPNPNPNPNPNTNTKTYPFGTYTGGLRNGIPEGDGRMTYSCRVQIAKHDTDNPPHYAEAGDYFEGSWGNGDIVSGYVYRSDGSIKERIMAPKRFNPYDISND